MVLAWQPDVDVDAASLPSTIENAATTQGGTMLQHQAPGDLDSVVEIQGPVTQKNPYQELNLFIGECCRNWSLTPMAAVAMLMDMLQSIRDQTYHAGGGSGVSLAGPRQPPPIT